MFREFVRLVRSWRPDWIVFENVKGIAETESGAFLKLILKRFESLGYTLSSGILNAAKFGVPQNRERLFVIGSRHRIKVSMPSPSVIRPIPVQRALADLPDVDNGADVDRLPYKCAARSAYVKQLRNGEDAVSGNLVTRNADFVLKCYEYIQPGGNWEDIPTRLMTNYRKDFTAIP
jgi:DNA (cytosine-5)-methyltransferase 1